MANRRFPDLPAKIKQRRLGRHERTEVVAVKGWRLRGRESGQHPNRESNQWIRRPEGNCCTARGEVGEKGSRCRRPPESQATLPQPGCGTVADHPGVDQPMITSAYQRTWLNRKLGKEGGCYL